MRCSISLCEWHTAPRWWWTWKWVRSIAGLFDNAVIFCTFGIVRPEYESYLFFREVEFYMNKRKEESLK